METSTASVDAQATFLLERIALVSDEDCPKEDVMTVMNDVNTWLCEQDDTFSVSDHLPCCDFRGVYDYFPVYSDTGRVIFDWMR